MSDLLPENELSPEEREELRRLQDAVPFRGNYSDLGEQEDIRHDYLREKKRERESEHSHWDGGDSTKSRLQRWFEGAPDLEESVSDDYI